MFNVENKIGGDAGLSPRGRQYGAKLAEFMKEQAEVKDESFKLWCSTLQRTIETASFLSDVVDGPAVRWRALSEIEAGLCDGLAYEDVQTIYPEEFEMRKKDKLRYRYPQGESYLDVIQRLEPIIFALERSTSPILVVFYCKEIAPDLNRLLIEPCCDAYMHTSSTSLPNKYLS